MSAFAWGTLAFVLVALPVFTAAAWQGGRLASVPGPQDEAPEVPAAQPSAHGPQDEAPEVPAAQPSAHAPEPYGQGAVIAGDGEGGDE